MGCRDLSTACCTCPTEDPQLTELGRLQIKDVAAQLSEQQFLERSGVQVVAHSDLSRTRETCKGIFGSAGVPVLELGFLREWWLFRDCLPCFPWAFRARVRQC